MQSIRIGDVVPVYFDGKLFRKLKVIKPKVSNINPHFKMFICDMYYADDTLQEEGFTCSEMWLINHVNNYYKLCSKLGKVLA